MSFSTGIITSAATLALDTLIVRPRRSIGPLVMQVTLEERHQDDIEITDHPIEQGAIVSDHAFKRPAEVTIVGAWSSSPSLSGLIDGVVGGLKATVDGVTSILSGQAPHTLGDIYDTLIKLQKNVIPFDIYTGKRRYTNMLIRSLSVNTDKTSENSLMVTMVCREIQTVSTSVLTVPADATRHLNPSSTVTPVSSGTKSLLPADSFYIPTF